MARLILEQRMVPRGGGNPTDLHEMFTVVEPFRVAHRITGIMTVPAGRCCFASDLASVPWFLVWLIGRTGRHLRAAIAHDWMIDRLGTPDAPVGDRRTADRVFLDLMAYDGVPLGRRRLIHTAVALATDVAAGQLRRVRAGATVALPAVVALVGPWFPWGPGPALGAVGAFAAVIATWGRRAGVAMIAAILILLIAHVTAGVIVVRSTLVSLEALIGRVDSRRLHAGRPDAPSVAQSAVGVPGSTSSLVAVVANSTDDGGTKPSTAWKVKCCEPGRSGSSATSTTMISPAENSL